MGDDDDDDQILFVSEPSVTFGSGRTLQWDVFTARGLSCHSVSVSCDRSCGGDLDSGMKIVTMMDLYGMINSLLLDIYNQFYYFIIHTFLF